MPRERVRVAGRCSRRNSRLARRVLESSGVTPRFTVREIVQLVLGFRIRTSQTFAKVVWTSSAPRNPRSFSRNRRGRSALFTRRATHAVVLRPHRAVRFVLNPNSNHGSHAHARQGHERKRASVQALRPELAEDHVPGDHGHHREDGEEGDDAVADRRPPPR
jgi:hypothetical protein